ncbi:MAG: glycoside hydrolase family 27 protein [Ruminococcaceae bacterium]|nr:glycoside hydrolase family 27 protein [Oscillospiraceae bacterium]
MLAQRPPMGWNSWNTFGENISEALIMETADAMVERGLKDAGYEYIVIDDCWSLRKRGEDGRIVPDPQKFPHGMKYLADYIHSKGLKFGMYTCAGTMTCACYPGSYDHEFLDAQTFADWGVDYLKYDNCYVPEHVSSPMLYRRMGMALKATGRDIIYSMCNWGCDDVHSWARSVGGHIYRSTGDIYDNTESFRNIAISQIPKLGYSAPGCFNDVDMLICGMGGNGNVGAGGCTADEYKMHFSLWCMMNSPLMIGCDIRNCDEDTLALLKNPALIAINQDEEARPPIMVFRCAGYPDKSFALFKHLSGNRYCLAHYNFHDDNSWTHMFLENFGIPETSGYTIELFDMDTGDKYLPDDGTLNLNCPGRSCKLYEVKIVKR